MTLSVRPQPLLAVRDVEKSSAWCCGVSAHGGAEYENPNAGHRELWVRDPDHYLVVFAGK